MTAMLAVCAFMLSFDAPAGLRLIGPATAAT
jgi:hypothetical protein